ncbi:Ig-like domain-containing protein [Pontibacter sp. SGAir0037]|uniref:Ig-like domain-containing protein n=1 Tax=Pontibacter sp. SGAir0037 TaxID=2571030 RepID=UPI00143DF279|nr:Ig-like domain-containing protein [Pontibacter sp. SGAir0037]
MTTKVNFLKYVAGQPYWSRCVVGLLFVFYGASALESPSHFKQPGIALHFLKKSPEQQNSLPVLLQNNNVTPTAGNDIAGSVCNGATKTISAAILLQNDSEPNGKPLKIQEFTQPRNGKLTDNGNGTYSYTPNPGFSGNDTFTYIIKEEDNTVAFSGNGHYFEYVMVRGITWKQARVEAEKRTYKGLQGYLATMSSKDENDFVKAKLRGEGWIGASDEEQEGVWKWMTGPEAGTQFSRQGQAVNGMYSNWAPNEPNNWQGGEHYGHFYPYGENAGTWNDYANDNPNIEGYMVEYGGLELYPPVLTATATVSVEVLPAPVIQQRVTDVSCAGQQDGSIEIIAAPSTSYSFNGGSYATSGLTFSGLAAGTYTISARAASNGCESTLRVTVRTSPDTEAPVIAAPKDIKEKVYPGKCTVTNLNLGVPVKSDNCSEPTVTNDAPSSFAPGTTVVTWTATDRAGNKATATQKVVVEEADGPMLALPPVISTVAGDNICGAFISYDVVTRCSVVKTELLSGFESGAIFPVGTTEVKIRATDAAGKSSTESFYVTVTDHVKPVILVKPFTLNLNFNCTGSLSFEGIDYGTADNCGIERIQLSKTEFSCSDLGTNYITVTATDVHGNVSQATTTVTVAGDMLVAYPNPFNPNTSIDFTLAEAGTYRLELLDMRGIVIGIIAEGTNERAAYITHMLDGEKYGLAEGLYIARLVTSKGTRNLKIALKK